MGIATVLELDSTGRLYIVKNGLDVVRGRFSDPLIRSLGLPLNSVLPVVQ